MAQGYKIYLRDPSLNRQGQVDDFSKLEMVLRYNNVSTWTLTIPWTNPMAALVDDGWGIQIVRNGVTILSGPMLTSERRWSKDEDTLTISGLDDLVWLSRRLALPVTAGPPYTAQGYDVRTGVTETVIKAYVNNNAGPLAQSQRRVTGLTIATDQVRGSTVTGRARFDSLLDLTSSLALAGGDLGFSVVQNGTSLVFDVYQPTDRTKTAIFSQKLGNLKTFSYSTAAALGNYAVVGGGGEDTARTFVEGGDSDSIVTFGRIETFIDRRDTTSSTELTQAMNENLASMAQQVGLSITPVDTTTLGYGNGYQLGDQITVMVDGVPFQDVVREVKVTLNASADETIMPTVGTPKTGSVLSIFKQLKDMKVSVKNLQRR
jgi:hypothetical protein